MKKMKKVLISLSLVLALVIGTSVKSYATWHITIEKDGSYTAEYEDDGCENCVVFH